ncbi:MAG: T9SS type A sorting domain-containing protein [Candidatus Cloacimonetes bacterium]|nr:T9SS type A sorting domain-containing protein [Candidatus Cloacimonadota bacterium]
MGVNIIVPVDFIVYGVAIWCWIESGTYTCDCLTVTSESPRCVFATFSIPYYFPVGSCDIWVYSEAEPDPWAAPFEIVPDFALPYITCCQPNYAIQGESIDAIITAVAASSYDPMALLLHDIETIPATSVQQTGVDEFIASFNIPSYTTPGDWLLVLHNLEVNGTEGLNINTSFPIYSNLTGNLCGLVVKGGTRDFIEGATITCTYKSTLSTETGYNLDDIPIGNHLASCSADGFFSSEDFVTIEVGQTAGLNFVLDWTTCNPDPSSIFKHVPPNDTHQSSVELINLGNTDFSYNAGFTVWYPKEKNFGDLLFSFDATAVTGSTKLFGINTDGSYLYLTDYDISEFHQLELDGTLVNTFSIPGVSEVRGLAYDGTYFYGGKREMYFWEMDFGSQSLISTTNTLMQIRAITYDPINDGFWVNNCLTDLRFIDRSGIQWDLIASPGYMMSVAYDGFSDGGPYLWCFRGINGPIQDCWIEQIDIATGQPTGVEIQVNNDLGDGYAAGLFCSDQIIPGKVVLGGIISQDTQDVVFGYEIKSDSWATITENASGTIPAEGSTEMTVVLNATGMSAGETHYGKIIIEHNGSDTTDVVIPVTMVVSYDVDEPPTSQTSFANHYPNPATGSVEVNYTIPHMHEGEEIPINIYNIRGQLINSVQGKDGYAIWNTEKISSGIYFYKIQRDDIELVNKVLIIK